jgi:hypothetical protein
MRATNDLHPVALTQTSGARDVKEEPLWPRVVGDRAGGMVGCAGVTRV